MNATVAPAPAGPSSLRPASGRPSGVVVPASGVRWITGYIRRDQAGWCRPPGMAPVVHWNRSSRTVSPRISRPTCRYQSPDALDFILRGRAAGLKPPSRDTRAEANSLYQRAPALDPASAEAQSRLARVLAVACSTKCPTRLRPISQARRGIEEGAVRQIVPTLFFRTVF